MENRTSIAADRLTLDSAGRTAPQGGNRCPGHVHSAVMASSPSRMDIHCVSGGRRSAGASLLICPLIASHQLQHRQQLERLAPGGSAAVRLGLKAPAHLRVIRLTPDTAAMRGGVEIHAPHARRLAVRHARQRRGDRRRYTAGAAACATIHGSVAPTSAVDRGSAVRVPRTHQHAAGHREPVAPSCTRACSIPAASATGWRRHPIALNVWR